jgi:hypothetical protein
VTEALHTMYRVLAITAFAAVFALAAVVPAGGGAAVGTTAGAAAAVVTDVTNSHASVDAAGWVGVVTKALCSRKFQRNCALLVSAHFPVIATPISFL